MASEIEVARPGVVLRKRVARKPKRCAACGCPIIPGKATGIENVAGKGLASQFVRRLVAEFVGRSYNKGLFSYAVRKLEGR